CAARDRFCAVHGGPCAAALLFVWSELAYFCNLYATLEVCSAFLSAPMLSLILLILTKLDACVCR
ncbi:hypothetical protein M2T40_29000, partial [Klebsiella pneumoniae]|nr:hypothetical protein [Klebsiella pneumoniae]